MRRDPKQIVAWLGCSCALGAVLMAAMTPAAAQSDRERAQLLQMQQQLQRLQTDNAAAQKEKGELQSKAQQAEQAQKQAGQELARTRQAVAAQGKELAGARAELASTAERLAAAQAQIENLRRDLAQRDDALQHAAIEKQRADAQISLLSNRLKLNTARADLCETRHAGLMKFSSTVIDRYEAERLRLCEPLTGIWKVRNETQVQQMREEQYGYRLDVPAPADPVAKAGEGATDAAAARPGAAAPAGEPAAVQR